MKKEITITEDRLLEAIAETMTTENIKELLSIQPMLSLVMVPFGIELTNVLFKEEE